MKIACFLLMLFLPLATFADDYWTHHSIGWHWYEKTEATEKEAVKAPTNTGASASETLKKIQAEFDEAKAQAVLNPSAENVYHYLVLQNALFNKAADFSNTWRQLVWQHPELSDSNAYPSNLVARQTYTETRNEEEDKSLKAASQEYGLFFFFAGSCPYCHRFAPIFKSVTERYQFDVLAISLDGGNLPEYPTPIKDQGQAQELHVTRWPAVYLVNAKKREVIPVSFGLISEADLKKRLVTLTKGLALKEAEDAKTQ